MPSLDPALRPIFPRTAGLSPEGRLSLGGCDAVELARQYGTPLYVFDEVELRESMRAYRRAFEALYDRVRVSYASKAFLARWIAAIAQEEGLGFDAVSGGELAVLLAAGVPAGAIDLHGNNKSETELREALAAGVRRVVVDNLYELELLGRVAGEAGRRQPILLRLSPGVDPHTHVKTTTGTLDSKFGIPIVTGDAERAVRRALELASVELTGLHCHLGSPIFEIEPYIRAAEVVLGFASEMRARYGFELREYSPGGGFAAQYVREQPAPAPEAYAEAIVTSVRRGCERHGLPLPALTIEPGRALVARAGVALYTVGAIKRVPGVRTFVAVDGGMADNIRPAMYGSRYEVMLASRAPEGEPEVVTIAGKYCESGDILAKDVALPPLRPGDLLAMPAAGAYQIAMASNYNMALKPAIVLVRDGVARLVRRRETYRDLMNTDVRGE
jgi:diaminopimelate decarboxylase